MLGIIGLSLGELDGNFDDLQWAINSDCGCHMHVTITSPSHPEFYASFTIRPRASPSSDHLFSPLLVGVEPNPGPPRRVGQQRVTTTTTGVEVDSRRRRVRGSLPDLVIRSLHGRVGSRRSQLVVGSHYHDDERALHVRIDCAQNPEFWLEFDLQLDSSPDCADDDDDTPWDLPDMVHPPAATSHSPAEDLTREGVEPNPGPAGSYYIDCIECSCIMLLPSTAYLRLTLVDPTGGDRDSRFCSYLCLMAWVRKEQDAINLLIAQSAASLESRQPPELDVLRRMLVPAAPPAVDLTAEGVEPNPGPSTADGEVAAPIFVDYSPGVERRWMKPWERVCCRCHLVVDSRLSRTHAVICSPFGQKQTFWFCNYMCHRQWLAGPMLLVPAAPLVNVELNPGPAGGPLKRPASIPLGLPPVLIAPQPAVEMGARSPMGYFRVRHSNIQGRGLWRNHRFSLRYVRDGLMRIDWVKADGSIDSSFGIEFEVAVLGTTDVVYPSGGSSLTVSLPITSVGVVRQATRATPAPPLVGVEPNPGPRRFITECERCGEEIRDMDVKRIIMTVTFENHDFGKLFFCNHYCAVQWLYNTCDPPKPKAKPTTTSAVSSGASSMPATPPWAASKSAVTGPTPPSPLTPLDTDEAPPAARLVNVETNPGPDSPTALPGLSISIDPPSISIPIPVRMPRPSSQKTGHCETHGYYQVNPLSGEDDGDCPACPTPELVLPADSTQTNAPESMCGICSEHGDYIRGLNSFAGCPACHLMDSDDDESDGDITEDGDDESKSETDVRVKSGFLAQVRELAKQSVDLSSKLGVVLGAEVARRDQEVIDLTTMDDGDDHCKGCRSCGAAMRDGSVKVCVVCHHALDSDDVYVCRQMDCSQTFHRVPEVCEADGSRRTRRQLLVASCRYTEARDVDERTLLDKLCGKKHIGGLKIALNGRELVKIEQFRMGMWGSTCRRGYCGRRKIAVRGLFDNGTSCIAWMCVDCYLSDANDDDDDSGETVLRGFATARF